MRLPNGDLEWTVDADLPPLRADHYLKIRLPSYGRAVLQRYIRDGGVKRVVASGGLARLKPATRVRAGDRLRIQRPEPPPRAELSAPRASLSVIYEDDALVVVDKPAGMLVHPSGVRIDNTVIGILREQYQDRLDLAHRLDRETSGVLVLTRTLAATRTMKEDFKKRRVHKEYLALVRGSPEWESRRVVLPLGDGGGEVRVRQTVQTEGSPAETLFRVVRRVSSRYTLLEAMPKTGRLHQIRVHLEALGLPVFADKIYGGDGRTFLDFYENGLTPELLEQLGHWRHALHAHKLRFRHPTTAQEMCLQAPLPQDLVEVVADLDHLSEASETSSTRHNSIVVEGRVAASG